MSGSAVRWVSERADLMGGLVSGLVCGPIGGWVEGGATEKRREGEALEYIKKKKRKKEIKKK